MWFFLITAALLASAECLPQEGQIKPEIKKSNEVVCVYTNWSAYRKGEGKFTIDNIDPSLCTTIYYAFAKMNTDSWKVEASDAWQDLAEFGGKAGYEKTIELKEINPDLKVVLGIGGWSAGSKPFSDMARDAEKRKTFAESAAAFIKKHKFDGMDISWQYPTERDGRPEDRDNFSQLLKEMRELFDKDGKDLSVSIGASVSKYGTVYDVEAVYAHAHSVNVLTFDYHGKWDGVTGFSAPLHKSSNGRGDSPDLNVATTMKRLKAKGADLTRTRMTIPTQAKSFVLKDEARNTLASPTVNTVFKGPITATDGLLSQYEFCAMTKEGNGKTVTDEESKVSYYTEGDKWVSFEDASSIEAKSDLAASLGLSGTVIWSLDMDDFKGQCGKEEFPLLRAINKGFMGKE